MGALASIFVGPLVDKLLGGGLDLVKQYMAGQITKEQLRTQLVALLAGEWAKVEIANADMIKSTYASFAQIVMSSRIVQGAYVFVVVTQSLVLLWAQVGVPYMVWKYGGAFPSSGATLDWGYGLLVLLLGGGMVAMRRPAQPTQPPKG